MPAAARGQRPAGGEPVGGWVVRRGQRRGALRDLRRARRSGSSKNASCSAPLPSLRPEIGARPASRKVDKLSCVRFGSARYSVPSRLIGTTVLIAVHGTKIRVLEPFTGEIAAEHVLVAPGEASIADAHYGSVAAGQAAARAAAPDRRREAVPGSRRGRVRRSCPALPRPGSRACPGRSTQILTLQAAHGPAALSRRWNGRRSSGGGGPMTCARSWPRPAPRRDPAPPGRRSC